MISQSPDQKTSLYLQVRRIIEVFIILLLSPLFMVIFTFAAIWILLDSRGSILFCQIRPGKDGKLFNMYKFRSMYHKADSSFLTLEDDQRVTKSGKFLRRYRIDELPQLWNILQGDMSLIGPRPVPVNFLEEYERKIKHYQLRHAITPGITGLAQVRQGYTTTVDEERKKLKYDLFYIKSVSLKLDCLILKHSFSALFNSK